LIFLDASYWQKLGLDELEKTLSLMKLPNTNIAKNVIIFVGDGMSMTTVTGKK
jgi:alkaline phosphatase